MKYTWILDYFLAFFVFCFSLESASNVYQFHFFFQLVACILFILFFVVVYLNSSRKSAFHHHPCEALVVCSSIVEILPTTSSSRRECSSYRDRWGWGDAGADYNYFCFSIYATEWFFSTSGAIVLFDFFLENIKQVMIKCLISHIFFFEKREHKLDLSFYLSYKYNNNNSLKSYPLMIRTILFISSVILEIPNG